jgi:hypothetical protein
MTYSLVVGGVEKTSLQLGQIFCGTAVDIKSPLISTEIGILRRGNVFANGNGDVVGVHQMDPHGAWFAPGDFLEEEFFSDAFAKFQVEHIINTGGLAYSTGSVALLTTGAASGDHSIVRSFKSSNWHTDGSRGMGFRARLIFSDVSNSEIRCGFWASDLGAPDNTSTYTGFTVTNGVITFNKFDGNGQSTTSTGVTATVGQAYWLSFYFDEGTGTIQWHVTSANLGFYNGYIPGFGTYGEIAATDINTGEDSYPYVGCKTTTASSASVSIDYIAAWSNQRGN